MDKNSPAGRSQQREWHGEGAVKEPGTRQAEAGPVCQAELPLAGDRELWEDAEVGKVANGARLPASRKHILGPNTGQGLWGTFLLVSSVCLSRSVHMGSWGPRPMKLPFTWGAFKKVEGFKRDSDYVCLEQDSGIRIFQSPPHDSNGLCSYQHPYEAPARRCLQTSFVSAVLLRVEKRKPLASVSLDCNS